MKSILVKWRFMSAPTVVVLGAEFYHFFESTTNRIKTVKGAYGL